MERQAAGKIKPRMARSIAHQHIGQAFALAAGQPGGDKGIGQRDLAAGPQRPPRQQHRHGRHMRRLECAQQVQPFIIVQGMVGAVARSFGIGRFAKHHHGGVGAGGKAAIRR